MITFLQGLNIGGKIYNGHSIISNNNNEDFVSEDSIYILVSDDKKMYHRVTEKGLEGKINNHSRGVLNIDFDRRVANVSIGKDEDRTKKTSIIYYYPMGNLASYDSIINYNGGGTNKSTYEYVKALANSADPREQNLAKIYYTALGRERYGMYRVTNKLEKVQEILREP